MKVLVIEDEVSLNQSIVAYLQAQGYVCESVTNFREALDKTDVFEYDCIVLDLMLPDGNGIKILEHLKADKKRDGVIILSAKSELDDKLTGLQSGADDYLTKPFHLAELGVRIAAIIRRKSFSGNTEIQFEEIKIDPERKTVLVSDDPISLTKTEFNLLLYLVINKNRVLSKDMIAEHLWGDNMDMVDNHHFIYTHVKNLRKKLEQAGSGDYIQNAYGMGYKFSNK